MRVGKLRRIALGIAAAVVMAGGTFAVRADAACQLRKIAELTVLNDQGSPLVSVGVNGRDASMLVDTGAARTMLLTSAARTLGLPLVSGPNGLKLYGAGGETTVYETTVNRFELGGASVPNLMLLVAGERQIGHAAGLLGWDLLSHWDLDFDLAHHVIRLLRPVGCRGDEVVYWSQTYHRAAIEPMTSGDVDIDFPVTLNHRGVEATLDSGASGSVLTPAVAAKVGAALTPSGERTRGLGVQSVPLFAASLDSFEIGGEEVRHVRIQAADLFAHNTYEQTGSILQRHIDSEPEMLLGADFLRAHHVLIAPDQNQLYFTYDGGPVFSAPPPGPAPDAAAH